MNEAAESYAPLLSSPHKRERLSVPVSAKALAFASILVATIGAACGSPYAADEVSPTPEGTPKMEERENMFEQKIIDAYGGRTFDSLGLDDFRTAQGAVSFVKNCRPYASAPYEGKMVAYGGANYRAAIMDTCELGGRALREIAQITHENKFLELLDIQKNRLIDCWETVRVVEPPETRTVDLEKRIERSFKINDITGFR